jgi:hypothetical protein
MGIRILQSVVLGCLAVIVSTSAAIAKCQIDGPPFIFLGDNGSYAMSIDMRHGDSCPLGLTPLNPAVKFDSVDMIAPAQAGVLRRASTFSYDYLAPATGNADRFSLKICGTDTRGRGCNVLNYSVTLRD